MSLKVKRMLWKDLVIEVRNLPEIGSALVFSVASSTVLGFSASRLSSDPFIVLTVGLIMIELFLAVFTSIMSVIKEEELGTLDGLRSSPVEPHILFLVKLIVNLVLLESLTIVALITTLILSGATSEFVIICTLVLPLGIYLAAVSSFSSAISIYLQTRGILLPTMILVLSLPAIQEALVLASRRDLITFVTISLSGLAFTILVSWLSTYVLE